MYIYISKVIRRCWWVASFFLPYHHNLILKLIPAYGASRHCDYITPIYISSSVNLYVWRCVCVCTGYTLNITSPVSHSRTTHIYAYRWLTRMQSHKKTLCDGQSVRSNINYRLYWGSLGKRNNLLQSISTPILTPYCCLKMLFDHLCQSRNYLLRINAYIKDGFSSGIDPRNMYTDLSKMCLDFVFTLYRSHQYGNVRFDRISETILNNFSMYPSAFISVMISIFSAKKRFVYPNKSIEEVRDSPSPPSRCRSLKSPPLILMQQDIKRTSLTSFWHHVVKKAFLKFYPRPLGLWDHS